MKTSIELFTESIINLIKDAQDNNLSLDFIKDKISIDFKDEYIEVEKREIVDAYRQGVVDWSINDFSCRTRNKLS